MQPVATFSSELADAKSKPRWNIALWMLAASLGILWFVLCRHLSSEWSLNEQYSYGWFVPFFAVYLFWLRWDDRPVRADEENVQRRTPNAQRRMKGKGIAIGIAILALLILLPVRLFEVANPAWRLLDWIHAIITVGITLLVLWLAGGKSWVRHFAFPVAFFLVAVPWVSAVEEPLVQGLMQWVAEFTTEAANLMGIPARVDGNVIKLSTALVGITEACSGVRSFQTSIMIGLLFGELRRLSVGRRAVLVLGTVLIAFAANVFRAFLLVWLAATKGISAMERGHDIAGYAIVSVVFLTALALAALLARGRQKSDIRSQTSEVRHQNGADIRRRTSQKRNLTFDLRPLISVFLLAWLVAVEIGVEAWYRSHERGLVRQTQWTVRWPEGAPEFRDMPVDARTRDLLRFDEGRTAIWNANLAPAASAPTLGPLRCLAFFFRWRSGHDSALLANFHRPDICLPATGWKQTQDQGVRPYVVDAELSVPFRHLVFVHRDEAQQKDQTAHVFYCLWQDQVRRAQESPLQHPNFPAQFEWSRFDRIRVVLEGQRHLGQQVLEILFMNPRPVDTQAAEEQFGALVRDIVVSGRR